MLHNIVVYVHIHRYFGLVSRLTSLTVLFVLLNAICLKRPDTSPDDDDDDDDVKWFEVHY